MAKQVWATMEHGRRHKKVVFLLGGWTYRLFMLKPAAFIMSLNGYHVVSYCYDVDIFSPDYEKTRRGMLAVKEDVLKRLQQLKKHDKTEFSVFGTSLGSILAVLVANESPEVKRVVLNTAGTDIAEAVWTWDLVKPWFKRELLNKNITLQQLAKEWKPISIIHNISNFANKEVLVYLAKKDDIIPYKLGQALVRRFKADKVSCKVIVNDRLIHSVAGLYNLVNPKKYLQFLKQ